MRVVIDTNVLVSAALKNKDPEAVIKWIVAHPDWLWLVTPEILSEYQAVRPFRLRQLSESDPRPAPSRA